MGKLVLYMQEFARELGSPGSLVSRKRISEWFKGKVAVKRENDDYEVLPNKRIAKVVIGVSGIGKSTYVRDFIVKNPSFVFISSDDALYQQMDEMHSKTKPDDTTRMVEIIEEQIINAQTQNIVIDVLCINPAYRAAMMRFLADLGYEIHIIYFSRKYTEANIKKCIMNRAIELALYQEYLASTNTQKMSIRDIMQVRENILDIYAKKRGVTVEELKQQTASTVAVSTHVVFLTGQYNDEIETNRVWWQELRGLFMLGADYYYEL